MCHPQPVSESEPRILSTAVNVQASWYPRQRPPAVAAKSVRRRSAILPRAWSAGKGPPCLCRRCSRRCRRRHRRGHGLLLSRLPDLLSALPHPPRSLPLAPPLMTRVRASTAVPRLVSTEGPRSLTRRACSLPLLLRPLLLLLGGLSRVVLFAVGRAAGSKSCTGRRQGGGGGDLAGGVVSVSCLWWTRGEMLTGCTVNRPHRLVVHGGGLYNVVEGLAHLLQHTYPSSKMYTAHVVLRSSIRKKCAPSQQTSPPSSRAWS